MRASPQIRLTRWWRRPLLPALTSCIYAAVGIGVCGLTIALARPALSPLERNLVGRWFTTHGNVESCLELRADRSVTVSQVIRVALSPDATRVFGPTVTTGNWRAEVGHLHLETTSVQLRATPWRKLHRFVCSQRWPANGELHRDWQIEDLRDDRLAFIDSGTGQRGLAIKAPRPAPAAQIAAMLPAPISAPHAR